MSESPIELQLDADLETASIKVPPHSLEAEQSVLGGLMLDNRAFDDVAEVVSDVDFYRRDHRLIYRAIAQLAELGKPFDVVTLGEALDNAGILDESGGMAYLAVLAKNTPSASNIKAYAEIVRERSVLRQMIQVSNEIADAAFRPEGRSSTELLDEAERKVFNIAEQGAKGGGPIPIKQALKATVDRIDLLFKSDEKLTGVPTGFTDLDEKTSGLQGGALVIVAARPAMGKTTFSMNVVENAMIRTGKPVLVFSMEMPAEQLVMRMLASLGRIDMSRVTTGKLEEDDWPRFSAAVSLLAEQKLFIDDSAGLSPTEVRARARRVARDQGELALIMVDYLQLMQVPGAENRVNEISEISRSLKGLAKEMNCPVVALSQLNRGLEQRPNKRPVMSDLRESGAIEQDADIIMFIYRDEVYNEDSEDKGTAEIIIGKQRNGPIGTVRLAFLGRYTRFEDLAHNSYGEF
ncbi:MAG: replicative DNA helicase [Gammaproteobacteria bacterium]